MTDGIRLKCERIFDYLYSKELVHTPVSFEADDDDSYEHPIDGPSYTQESSILNRIKQFLDEIEHSSTKQQLLAVVAVDFSPSILRAHFPTITDSQINAALKHIYRFGQEKPDRIFSKYCWGIKVSPSDPELNSASNGLVFMGRQ
ncbi:unnamed protein product [Rotaria socialis]|uniref:Uncharacterized protein n=1 Tax=Rotaria socialis TaxID=392032 RepID=A0A820VNV2_9BILA|nr:unnamed protein product [Rotaria socialis]CAF4504201.1 unnamed protein product [Rotaria socialis]CAF4862959.1 unnamed protein product [Rotaria socialis]